MNNKKICFITCVNDKILYDECLKYINSLYIPAGFQIETLNIENAVSMTSGYNAAMKYTDAKYKVYLHQDTYIINKNFIFDILNIFEADKNVGMIGVIGSKSISTDGIWRKSSHKYGQVYESYIGKMKLLRFNEVNGSFTDVKVVDGLIMATQYDVPWREDVFDGWDFYDISQCVEFSMKGYRIVVPAQKEPWCIHDCSSTNKDNRCEGYRKRFLDEYSKDIFPLVSIIFIIKDNTQNLKLSLKSILEQNYSNLEIIVCYYLDKHRFLCEKYLSSLKNIIYYKFSYKEYSSYNILYLSKLSHGLYINFMESGNIYHKNKIKSYVDETIDKESYTDLIVSENNFNDEFKINYYNILNHDFNVRKDNNLIYLYLINGMSLFGDFSNILIQTKCLKKIYSNYEDSRICRYLDCKIVLNILLNHKVIYYNKCLDNCYKTHEKIFLNYINLFYQFFYFKNNNYFKNKKEIALSLNNCLKNIKLYFLNNKLDISQFTNNKLFQELLYYYNKIQNFKNINSQQVVLKFLNDNIGEEYINRVTVKKTYREGLENSSIEKYNFKKVCFSCITQYHIFVSYILSKTVYKHDYKILFISDVNDFAEEVYKRISNLNVWDDVILIKEKYGLNKKMEYHINNQYLHDIDILHYFSWGSPINFEMIENVNIKNTKIYLTDEGIMTYLINEIINKDIINFNLKYSPIDFNKISEVWLFDRDLFCSNIKMKIRNIEFHKYLNNDIIHIFCSELNYIFDYKYKDLKYNTIFFDQGLSRVGLLEEKQEDYVLKNVVNIFKNNNLLIKKHPSDKVDKYKNIIDYKYIYADNVPWEVLYLNMIINHNAKNVNLVTYSSTADLSSIYIFKNYKNSKFILLYHILEEICENINESYYIMDKFIEKISEKYNVDFILPKSFKELKLYIDSLI